MNLADLVAKPLLVLGMDQGAPGMAASGFLRNHVLIEFYFDPIHRLSRDMKGAVTSAPKLVKQRLQLAHLAATYLCSLSYKPFRSGSFHQDKVELLEMFLSSEAQDMFYHVGQMLLLFSHHGRVFHITDLFSWGAAWCPCL